MKRDERRKASGRKNDSRGQRGYKGDTRRAERRAMPNKIDAKTLTTSMRITQLLMTVYS